MVEQILRMCLEAVGRLFTPEAHLLWRQANIRRGN
jgi:hypothetical protein